MYENDKRCDDRPDARSIRHQPASTGNVYEDSEYSGFGSFRIRNRHRCSKNRKLVTAVYRRGVCGCMGHSTCNHRYNSPSKKSVSVVGREFRLSDHRPAVRIFGRRPKYPERCRL